MGACDISFQLDNKATQNQIEQAFKRRTEADAEENGHREGYSGDFQTVDRVDYKHLGKVFPSQSEAFEFCLNKAEKWTTVVAVYYYAGRGLSKRIEAKLARISDKYKTLSTELDAVRRAPLDAFKGKAFKTCPECKSRLAVKHLDTMHLGLRCPLCESDWRPKRLQVKITKLEARLEALKTEAKAIRDAELTKQAEKAKASDIRTLIAGLGAC